MQQDHLDHKSILHPFAAAKHYNMHHYKPSTDLSPFVEHYWIVRWQLPPGVNFPAEILPNPSVNMSFTTDNASITGVITRKFTHALTGTGVAFGIRFHAGGFHPFLGRSITTITNETLPVDTVFKGDLSTLEGQALAQATDAELISRGESLLRSKQPRSNQHITRCAEIITIINSNHQVRQVQAVVTLSGVSERTLQYLFSEYIGVGPKWVINRYRLQDAAALISHGKNNWSRIALEAGYTDQSHFIRDFKNILGETPAEYAKRARDQSNSMA